VTTVLPLISSFERSTTRIIINAGRGIIRAVICDVVDSGRLIQHLDR
jgi:hypothetical protein